MVIAQFSAYRIGMDGHRRLRLLDQRPEAVLENMAAYGPIQLACLPADVWIDALLLRRK